MAEEQTNPSEPPTTGSPQPMQKIPLARTPASMQSSQILKEEESRFSSNRHVEIAVSVNIHNRDLHYRPGRPPWSMMGYDPLEAYRRSRPAWISMFRRPLLNYDANRNDGVDITAAHKCFLVTRAPATLSSCAFTTAPIQKIDSPGTERG